MLKYPTEFDCPFCKYGDLSCRLSARTFAEHMGAKHNAHNLHFITLYCQIPSFGGGIFVMFPPSNTCPIGDCTNPSLIFDHRNFGGHIRNMHHKTKKFTDHFISRLTAGDYFWWTGRRTKSSKGKYYDNHITSGTNCIVFHFSPL